MDEKKLEILCVTMHQKDFSKIQEMNIHSNVVFANQADETSYQECIFDGVHTARMITTDTRGVGKNRNLALLYSSGDICLFADDDVKYHDDMEKTVLAEFEQHPDADIFIFYLDTGDCFRKQKKYSKTRKCRLVERMPWGTSRVAVRRSSVLKANLWFTTLFGGGCIFPSGEDSMWLLEAKKAGLRFYVSGKTIGSVSFAESTWFTGFDEKMYFGKGAFYSAVYPKFLYIWFIYFAFRTRKVSELSFRERLRWLKLGSVGYRNLQAFPSHPQRR